MDIMDVAVSGRGPRPGHASRKLNTLPLATGTFSSNH